jgi:hypothetical protein
MTGESLKFSVWADSVTFCVHWSSLLNGQRLIDTQFILQMCPIVQSQPCAEVSLFANCLVHVSVREKLAPFPSRP